MSTGLTGDEFVKMGLGNSLGEALDGTSGVETYAEIG